MATAVKLAKCGHWVKADKSAEFYEEYDALVHIADGVKKELRKETVVLCDDCAKKVK